MDIDVSKMFQEKNKEIFKNNILLEMERNLDTLKSTTDNCVALEINKLLLFFKKYFDEIGLKYKKETLIKIVYDEKVKLNNIIKSHIENKKSKIKEEFINTEIKEATIGKDYIDRYYDYISNSTTLMLEQMELDIKKEICTEFTPLILETYTLKNVDEDERIRSRIDGLFNKVINRRIKEDSWFRDECLKNMCQETYNKYIELNKQTLETRN